MISVKRLEPYFKLAIDKQLLRFVTEPNSSMVTVEYHNTLTATGGEWKWSLLMMIDMADFTRPTLAAQRITMFMAESIRSKQQDINIIYDEYNLERKK